MKKILTVSLGALLIATAANADIASVDYVDNGLGGKQDTISDLGTIRSGAEAGASALQKADITTGTSNGTISVDGDDVSVQGLGSAAYTASTAYATAAQGTLAASAVQPGDLAAVATSGSYNDLTGKPTIPSGALASKSTITNADVADDAEIAQSKISGLTNALNGKQNASTAVRLTTTGEAVGDVKTPVYVNAGGVVTPITSYGGTAARATADGSGQTITTTYATKTELAGKQDKLVVNENITASNGVAIEQGQDGKLTIKGTGASSTAPGVLKLHNNVTGDDVDGTVTQSAIKTALATKQAALGYTPENVENKVTSTDGLTASSTDTQYPSAKLVYTAVNGKQDKLTTSNIKGSNGVSVGISNGVITVTGTTYSTGTADKSGLTKLYPDIGVNIDGTMTQSAIKAALGTKQDTISGLDDIRAGAAAGATALQKADITTGTSNGTISVDGTNVAVQGLGSAAYTASTAYATAAQGALAASAVQPATLDNYARKTDLNGKQDLVAGGSDGKFYVADYKSAWGDMFTLMPKDPECSNTDIKCALTHINGKYSWEIVRQ